MDNILPAIRSHKDFEQFLKTNKELCILLDFHIGQLNDLMMQLKKHHRKAWVHIDLIQGISSDKFGAEYLCQALKVDGLISTKPSVLIVAKKLGKVAIQRIFLIDRLSLEKSMDMVEKTKPDYVEVLPGIAADVMLDMNCPVQMMAGGLFRSKEEMERILALGFVAVTTSNRLLWEDK